MGEVRNDDNCLGGLHDLTDSDSTFQYRSAHAGDDLRRGVDHACPFQFPNTGRWYAQHFKLVSGGGDFGGSLLQFGLAPLKIGGADDLCLEELLGAGDRSLGKLSLRMGFEETQLDFREASAVELCQHLA